MVKHTHTRSLYTVWKDLMIIEHFLSYTESATMPQSLTHNGYVQPLHDRCHNDFRTCNHQPNTDSGGNNSLFSSNGPLKQ